MRRSGITRRSRCLPLLLITLGVAAPDAAPSPAHGDGIAVPQTILIFDSQVGDLVGHGEHGVYTPANSAWIARPEGGTSGNHEWIDVLVTPGDGRPTWRFTLTQSTPITPGEYGSSGMNVQFYPVRPPSGCGGGTGRAIVYEIEFGPYFEAHDGPLSRLAADVEFHCGDADPAMYAALRYNSTYTETRPFGGVYPRYELTVTPPRGGVVTGGGLACGGNAVACAATFSLPYNVPLIATPSPGYLFTGWKGNCAGASSETVVHVSSVERCEATFDTEPPAAPRTLLRWQNGSNLNDPYDPSGRRVFNAANASWTVTSYRNNHLGYLESGVRVKVGTINQAGESWPEMEFNFSAPAGEQLRPGEYNNARPSRHSTHPLLWLYPLTGYDDYWTHPRRFVVRELVVNPETGGVIAFAADFEVVRTPPNASYSGTIEFNSEVASCLTTDPFAWLGGGRCHNGGWLAPGMTPPVAAGCTTPDPFVALGGGTCRNGGWFPPAMITPPPPPVNGCATPDPFVALGGGTCRNGGWYPPGMALPPPPPVNGCATPDPFVALGGGTCRNGGWLPPGMGGGR